MSTEVKRRRGTASEHASFTGANGEITVNTTNNTTHVHDGVTEGGFESVGVHTLPTLTDLVFDSVADMVAGSPNQTSLGNKVVTLFYNEKIDTRWEIVSTGAGDMTDATLALDNGLFARLYDLTNVNILDFGHTNNTTNTQALVNAVNNGVNVKIPIGITIDIDADVTIPITCKKLHGAGRITMPSDVKITNVGTLPAPIATVAITAQTNTDRVNLGADYTGNYVWIDNDLPNMVIQAEGSPGNGVPIGSIDPIVRSKTNYSFNTNRQGLYEIVGYDSGTGESIIDSTLDFNIAAGTARVFDNVPSTKIRDLTIEADFPASLPGGSVRDNLQFNLTHRGGLENIKFKGYGVWFEIACSRCRIESSEFNVFGPVRVAENSIHNVIKGNTVNHLGPGDAAIIVYQNSRENVVVGNTVTAPLTDANWGIMFHTNSDNNTMVGNTVTATRGIGDYMFNKGNVISGNTATCAALLFEGVVKSSVKSNEFTITTGSSNILKCDDIEFEDNTFVLDSNVSAGINACVFSLFETVSPPFGFVGFKSLKDENVAFFNNTFTNKAKGSTVDYRTFVDYSSGNGALYFPRDASVYLANSKSGIQCVEMKATRLSMSGNEFVDFNASVVIHSTDNVPSTTLVIDNNEHRGADAAYILKTDDPSEQASILTASVYGDTFDNVDIGILSAQYPAYAKACKFNGVNSCMALASIPAMVYGAILDADNNYLGLNYTHYDYTGNDAAYLGQTTTTAVHDYAYFLPDGAEYYQPAATLKASQSNLFRNYVQVFGSSVDNQTIKRTITEISYS